MSHGKSIPAEEHRVRHQQRAACGYQQANTPSPVANRSSWVYGTVTGPWNTTKQMAHVVSAFDMLIFESGNETGERRVTVHTMQPGVRGPDFTSCSVDSGLKSTAEFSGRQFPL